MSADRGDRDRYMDLLRMLALIRIVTYHAFVWPWLTWIFPSLGVMFALAGSLMARSLDRRAWPSVLRTRMRRILVPFWAFGLFVVPAMFLHGWGPGDADDETMWWLRLLWWVIPLDDPPYSSWAWQVNAPVWYVRAYLWFVLLAPVLLVVFRRWPWPSVASFLVLAFLLDAGLPLGDVSFTGRVVTDLATYGACWMLGFAHRDGLINQLSASRVFLAVVAVMIIGCWIAVTQPEHGRYELGEIPAAQAYWSCGFVLLLLRFQPRGMGWLHRTRPLDRLVSLFNARAVTVYLWHEVALVASVALIVWMWSAGPRGFPATRDRLVEVRADLADPRGPRPALRLDRRPGGSAAAPVVAVRGALTDRRGTRKPRP